MLACKKEYIAKRDLTYMNQYDMVALLERLDHFVVQTFVVVDRLACHQECLGTSSIESTRWCLGTARRVRRRPAQQRADYHHLLAR